jgi:Predicted membrane protein (DUF2306)
MIGFFAAQKRQFNEHRKWMLRSFAIMAGTVSVNRIVMNLPVISEIPDKTLFLISWTAGVIISLVLAEYFLKKPPAMFFRDVSRSKLQTSE